MAYEKSFSVDVTTEEYVQAIDWVKNDYDSDGYEVEVKIQFPCLDILHIITEILKDGGMLNGETTRVFAENDERGVINLNQVSGIEKEGHKVYLTEELHDAYIRWRRNYHGLG